MTIKITPEELKIKNPSDMVPLECEHCKTEFHEKAGIIKTYQKIGRINGLKFCSRICRGKAKVLNIEEVRKVFEERGATLLEEIYKNAKEKMRYICKCGKEHSSNFNNFKSGKDHCPQCALNSRSQKNRLDYETVAKTIRKNTDLEINMTKEEYDSMKIGNRKLRLICKKGHLVYRTTSNLNKNHNCYPCFYERNRGTNHPNWVHGRSEEHRLHRNNYKTLDIDWKKKVIKRDDYKCVLCGSKNKIIGHHLNGYNWDVENRYNVDNGVTLCLDHHKEFHKAYGNGWNTKEQYEEFEKQKRAELNPLLVELEIIVYN
jgi:hypothetical protein